MIEIGLLTLVLPHGDAIRARRIADAVAAALARHRWPAELRCTSLTLPALASSPDDAATAEAIAAAIVRAAMENGR